MPRPSLPPRDNKISCFPRCAGLSAERSRDLPRHRTACVSPSIVTTLPSQRLATATPLTDSADAIDPTVRPRVCRASSTPEVHRPAGVLSTLGRATLLRRSAPVLGATPRFVSFVRVCDQGSHPRCPYLPGHSAAAFPAPINRRPSRARVAAVTTAPISTRVRAAGVPLFPLVPPR